MAMDPGIHIWMIYRCAKRNASSSSRANIRPVFVWRPWRRASNFATRRITGTRGVIAPGAQLTLDLFPKAEMLCAPRRAAKRLVKAPVLYGVCHSKCHSPEGGTRLYIRKTFIPWSPLYGIEP
jgi:hypothetical protein